ncbi:MAG: NYN domain-containing protein [Gemmatimonadetes bacterium]|nr:NYN domain-containing protein [Gemmatimonadota bacterium]
MTYRETTEFKQNEALIADLKLQPNFAVRLGELANRGWRLRHRVLGKLPQKDTQRYISASDIRPNLVQKGIDVMMAIDMVTLSLKRLVGAVVIITGDGDLVPALKLARVEGLRVLLVKPKGDVQIAKELFVHADLVIEI